MEGETAAAGGSQSRSCAEDPLKFYRRGDQFADGMKEALVDMRDSLPCSVVKRWREGDASVEE
jgi:hypothetical protein